MRMSIDLHIMPHYIFTGSLLMAWVYWMLHAREQQVRE